jgi:hypothetical protein
MRKASEERLGRERQRRCRFGKEQGRRRRRGGRRREREAREGVAPALNA